VLVVGRGSLVSECGDCCSDGRVGVDDVFGNSGVVDAYAKHYNEQRRRRSLGQQPPLGEAATNR
jgi:hypothetical protein